MRKVSQSKSQPNEELDACRERIRNLEASELSYRQIAERYQEYFDNIEDGCFEITLQGQFLFGNKKAYDFVGYTPDEYKAISYEKRHPTKEEAARVFHAFQEVYKTGRPLKAFEYQLSLKSGEVRTAEVTVSLIRDAEGRPVGFRGIGRDVTERKRMEEEREKYREFFKNVEDACFESDLSGNIFFGNKVLQKLTGYSLGELSRLRPRDLHPKDAEMLRRVYAKTYQTGIPSGIFDYELLRKDGIVRNVQVSVSLIRDHAGRPVGFRGIGRDVTERKAVEREQARFRAFLENVEDSCWEMNLAGDYIFANESTYRMLGYSPEEFMALKRKQRGATSQENDRIFKIFNNIYRTGIPQTGILVRHLNKAGEPRILEMSVSLTRDDEGNPSGFRGISRDVTDRIKADEEQSRYRDFLENIEDGCFEVDLSGNFTFANEAAARRFGYEKREIIGINNRQYMSQAESKKVYKIFHDVYQTGEPAKVFDLEVTAEGREARYLELSVSLIRNAQERPVGFRGISRDITERRRLTEQLNQAQKLEAVGTLAGGLAHDFNNLLMGIQGYVSLVLLETEPFQPNYEKLKAIESQVKSGADLTRQLLGYARGGRYEVKPIDMNDLIGKTAAMFSRTKKELRIHQNFTPDLWSVEADRGQMEQVLLNLFVNAWQAMPGGGALYLETENILLNETNAETYDVSSGPYVKISVTDTGMGMDELTKGRIFEPFFTTKSMGRGAGLGLASVYGIVRGHKGAIHVYSEKGHGSSFNLYLPASEKNAVIQDPHDSRVVRGHETVLLVDDERMITDVTGALIEGLGYQVIIANSCEEACAVFKDRHAQIDLVIMDMIMPGDGGAVAIDKMLVVNPGVKIILSSGYSLNGEAKHIMDRGGARAFLQKPFTFDVLSQKIREVLES